MARDATIDSMPDSEILRRAKERVAQHKSLRMGIVKKKVLLLLFGGLALGLSGSPSTYWKIAGALYKDWKQLSKQSTERAINSLYASRLIDVKENSDGTYSLFLSERGKRKVLTYNIGRMKVNTPPTWDRLWRLVSFDVPVDKKEVRDSLRGHLLRLGFCEVQQSLFMHPFDCANEITYLTELYDAGKYVRFMLVTQVDNELYLKKFFGLN